MEGQVLRSTTWSIWPHGTWPVFNVADYTVSPIVELIDFHGFLDIDVSDTNILITASVDRPAAFDPQVLDFEDINRTIPRFVGVTVNPATTWEGFEQGRAFFDANRIGVSISQLSAVAGQQISLDIATMVPEPAAGALAVLALAAMAAAVRRNRRFASSGNSRSSFRIGTPLLVFAWMAAPLTASAVTISWVQVGAPGKGAVPYEYRIGKYDVTVSQYVEFLNAKDAAGSNPLGLYNSGMSDATHGGVSFDASANVGSKYGVTPGRGNHPVNYVTWYDAIRFANWLNNGQGDADTETGAYTLGPLGEIGVPLDGMGITRNLDAAVHLPNFAEWTKAAYYDALRDSNFNYPTSRSAIPTASPPTAVGNCVNAENVVGNVTDVGAYTGTTSPCGAYDMAGNVGQWVDDLHGGPPPLGPREIGGSGFDGHIANMSYGHGSAADPTASFPTLGLRVASRVPEPGSCALAAMAAGAMCWRRRER
jgi:formylglycine-generating enzyme required for sulfatase activity